MKLKKWMVILIVAVVAIVGFYQGVKPLYQDISSIWTTVTQTETEAD